ncbi:MAG TPA: hypothetical protein VMD07_00200 [Candidatus Acidoferrales bacterium]|nr:hypothetical protein [Candidatus Acidoferrales bacterium]
MTLKRIVLPALFVTAAIVGAVTTGCHGSGSVAATPSPVPTCAGCTPIPTATPGGPTPTPSPTPTSYQPLANNDAWSYTCNAGYTANKLVTTGPILQGTQTLADTLTVTNGTTTYAVTADEANDGLGNTSVYQWVFGNSATTLTTPGLEFGTNETTGQTSTYFAPVTGNFTTTFVGPVGTVNGYSNVVEFTSVNSSPIVSLYGEIDTYTALAVGPVQLNFPDYSTPLVCNISGAPTINGFRRH